MDEFGKLCEALHDAVITEIRHDVRHPRVTLLLGDGRRLECGKVVIFRSESYFNRLALSVNTLYIAVATLSRSTWLIDAALSRDLLLAIFEPGAMLHDGAVIIQRDRIAAAACFLPLSMNPVLTTKLGTRHRAAIGITEETDCLSMVVSEETGRISVAAFGEIELDVTLKRAGERIVEHFGRRKRPWRPSEETLRQAPQEPEDRSRREVQD